MEDIKKVVAGNIAALRQKNGMTQIELAEKLNYSDKSVSKWERGESLPDITVLMEIASMFSVTLDYLVSPEHEESLSNDAVNTTSVEEERRAAAKKRSILNHGFITGMSILLVWLVATIAFVICDILSTIQYAHWLAFAYAVPASMITWLVFNTIWFNRKRNFLIISLLMWSTLAVLCLSFTIIGHFNIWIVMSLGVFGQAIIFFWSRLKYVK